jgi:hypothetical protein
MLSQLHAYRCHTTYGHFQASHAFAALPAFLGVPAALCRYRSPTPQRLWPHGLQALMWKSMRPVAGSTLERRLHGVMTWLASRGPLHSCV